jgi:DNA polymerase epsilon subunit 4
VARVQKIINADPERLHTSKNAAFAIAMATEMFIQHLATSTHNVVKTERKPRRNIQYRDVASAVAKTDNLEFLVDVVPKTMTYKEFKKRQDATNKAKALAAEKDGKKAAEEETEEVELKPKARGRVNGHNAKSKAASADEPDEKAAAEPTAAAEATPDAMDVDERPEDDSEGEGDAAAMQIEMEMRGPRTNGSPQTPRQSGGFTAVNGSGRK